MTDDRHIDPERTQFDAFKALPRDTVIHMLNLVRFRDKAAYPAGHPLAGHDLTGADAYANYGRDSGPVFQRVGGRIVWRGTMEAMLIGPDGERWHAIFVAEYPNSGAFMAMVTDPRISRSRRPPAGRSRDLAPHPYRAGAESVPVRDSFRLTKSYLLTHFLRTFLTRIGHSGEDVKGVLAMIMRGKWLVAGLLVAAAPLAGCRDNPNTKAELSPLDDGLTNADPTIKGSLEDKIMVDPKLTGQANQNAVGPGNKPIDGGVPGVAGSKAATAAEAAAAQAVGKLLAAPKALPYEADCKGDCATAAKRPVTIGALAREQAKGSCDAKLTYGNTWADRLPPAFRLYPRATLREAAGVAGGKCNIRVVNFQTAASMQAVLDYYHTMAVRAGYTSDHRLNGDEHVLGGTKGELAYVLFMRRDGGMTDVDLVASGGK